MTTLNLTERKMALLVQALEELKRASFRNGDKELADEVVALRNELRDLKGA